MEVVLEDVNSAGIKSDLRSEVRKAGRIADATLKLTHQGQTHYFAIEVRSHVPYRSQFDVLRHSWERLTPFGVPTLVAPFVTETQARRLSEAGWSWADEQGNYDLASGPLRLRRRLPADKKAPRVKAFPTSPAALKIVRALIGRSEIDQSWLAAAAGVTQPRVSQVLSQLRAIDLVQGKGRILEWDRRVLLEAFLERYQGPGGSEKRYYSLEPPLELAADIARTCGRDRVAVSADAAADLLAPYRRPTDTIVYLRSGTRLDPELLQFETADVSEEANVFVRWPRDESVFGLDELQPQRLVYQEWIWLADPAQIIWDLRALGGRDREEASEAVMDWLIPADLSNG